MLFLNSENIITRRLEFIAVLLSSVGTSNNLLHEANRSKSKREQLYRVGGNSSGSHSAEDPCVPPCDGQSAGL